jgi:hypothetical protein
MGDAIDLTPSIDHGSNLTQNIVAAIENTSQTLEQIQEHQKCHRVGEA